MENKKERHNPNNYVVFKHGNDCYEGRIKSITIEGSTEYYNIFSFTTFTDYKIPSTDIICNLSQEVKRKMRSTAYNEIPNQIYFPSELKNVLVVDKEWSIENQYDLPPKINVNLIIKHFKDFILNSACICDMDEANEVQKGFISLFNALFKRYLVYSNEIDQINSMKGEPSEYCGPVHFLRLVYYIQKNIDTCVRDHQVRNIILDYTIYFLDFMLIKYKEYF